MPRIAKASLALDLHPGDKEIPALVRSVAKEPGSLRVAAAYITGNAAVLLGLPSKGSLRRLRVICDPDSGNCDPASLSALTDRGADVRCMSRLHTKVYLSSRRAVVGSSNLSPAALKVGSANATIEAGALISDIASVRRLELWFDELHAGAVRWLDIVGDVDHYSRIVRAYRSKTTAGRHSGRKSKREKGHVPLLAAVQNPQRDLWRDTVFSLISNWDDDSDSQARMAANRAGLALSDDYDYEVIVGPAESDLRYYRTQSRAYADGRGPVVLTLYVKRRNDRVIVVEDVDEEAERLVDALQDKDSLFMYYEPAWTPVDLGPKSRRAMVNALNEALKTRGNILIDDARFIRATKLAQLLRNAGL